MDEMATPENAKLVARVYSKALKELAKGRTLSPADEVVYEVEMLSQEVNSGASFEQYFRWASTSEIARIVGRLESLGLQAVAQLATSAIAAAFPNGLPTSDDEKEDLSEWTEEQENHLSELAEEFTRFNGEVINVLGKFHRENEHR